MFLKDSEQLPFLATLQPSALRLLAEVSDSLSRRQDPAAAGFLPPDRADLQHLRTFYSPF